MLITVTGTIFWPFFLDLHGLAWLRGLALSFPNIVLGAQGNEWTERGSMPKLIYLLERQ